MAVRSELLPTVGLLCANVSYSGEEYVTQIRDREVRTALALTKRLSGNSIFREFRTACVTRTTASLLKWLLLENLPGQFPFTAGVFAVQARGRRSDAHVRR